MASIREIAKRAKVAPSTVSNVLNGTKPVTDQVRDRVNQAINELGYQPNLIARSLKTKQTNTIGVIVPELTNAFFIEIVNAIEAYLYEQNYSILVCCTRESKQKEEKYLRNLLQRGIDGLILLGTGLNPDLIENDLHIPAVLVDRMIGNTLSSVTIDNELGGYIATQHLLSRGARKTVFLPGPLVLQTNIERLQGYQRALSEYDLAYNPSLVIQCPNVTYEGGWSAMAQLDDQGVDYDGVFAASDFLAIGALRYLLAHKKKVPGEVKLVGFDGISTTEILTPSITTVVQPQEKMGRKAAQILTDLISQKSKGKQSVIYKPELMIRESS